MTGTPCSNCRHFDYDSPGFFRCQAYPNGIPEAILLGSGHSRPRGDEERPGFVQLPLTDEDRARIVAFMRKHPPA